MRCRGWCIRHKETGLYWNGGWTDQRRFANIYDCPARWSANQSWVDYDTEEWEVVW